MAQWIKRLPVSVRTWAWILKEFTHTNSWTWWGHQQTQCSYKMGGDRRLSRSVWGSWSGIQSSKTQEDFLSNSTWGCPLATPLFHTHTLWNACYGMHVYSHRNAHTHILCTHTHTQNSLANVRQNLVQEYFLDISIAYLFQVFYQRFFKILTGDAL